MQEWKYLIIHCTATKEGADISAKDIHKWHTDPKPKGRGWDRPGYSEVILLSGKTHRFSLFNGDKWIQDNEITYGVKGINSFSKHICYVGGLDINFKTKNTLNKNQLFSLELLIDEAISQNPKVLIAGHNQFSRKDCPSFFVPYYLKKIGVLDKNIYKNDPYGYGKLF